MTKLCRCKHTLDLAAVWDDPNQGYAFNLYICNNCGDIVKEDVWEDAGKTILSVSGEIIMKLKSGA